MNSIQFPCGQCYVLAGTQDGMHSSPLEWVYILPESGWTKCYMQMHVLESQQRKIECCGRKLFRVEIGVRFPLSSPFPNLLQPLSTNTSITMCLKTHGEEQMAPQQEEFLIWNRDARSGEWLCTSLSSTSSFTLKHPFSK